MIWILLKRGNEKFRYIKAEAPCMKGEATVPFLGFVITAIWGMFENDIKDVNRKELLERAYLYPANIEVRNELARRLP